MALSPPVGAMGYYVVLPPFATVIKNDVVYTCVAVRKFHDLRKEGIDPYARYYSVNGINKADFQRDESNEETIVSLADQAGNIRRLPSSYIKEFPSLGGYPYAVMGLTVAIGAMYNQTDMTPIVTAVKNAIKTYAGLDPTAITPIILSGTSYISSDAHNAIVKNRQLSIDTANTPNAELVRLRRENLLLSDRLAELEQYIADLNA